MVPNNIDHQLCIMASYLRDITRDHSGYGLSQWETTLQCKVVSHWLSPCPEWSKIMIRCYEANMMQTAALHGNAPMAKYTSIGLVNHLCTKDNISRVLSSGGKTRACFSISPLWYILIWHKCPEGLWITCLAGVTAKNIYRAFSNMKV